MKRFDRRHKQTERNNNPKHNAKVLKKKQEKYEKTLKNREENKAYRLQRSQDREQRKSEMENMIRKTDPKNPEFSRTDSEISRINRECSLLPEGSEEYKKLKGDIKVLSEKNKKLKNMHNQLEYMYAAGMY